MTSDARSDALRASLFHIGFMWNRYHHTATTCCIRKQLRIDSSLLHVLSITHNTILIRHRHMVVLSFQILRVFRHILVVSQREKAHIPSKVSPYRGSRLLAPMLLLQSGQYLDRDYS